MAAGDCLQLSSLLHAADCVVIMTTERDDRRTLLPWDTVRDGRVVAPYAVSETPRDIAGLPPDPVTISTLLFPGDSGSPVLAFLEGRPWLVGIATATRYPVEPLSYISRIDPLLPILEALQESPFTLLQAWQSPSMPGRGWPQE